MSGRIEGDDSNIAPKTSGRILEVRFREGDTVKTGDTIAVLDDAQVRAREEQARAALAASEARERSARTQLAAIQEQLQQSQLQTAQSKMDAEGRVRQAEADLSSAEAELAQQEASLKLALFDRDAYTRLAQTGAVSERQGRQAVATAEQQEAVVAAAKRRVEAARGALTTARANLDNPGDPGCARSCRAKADRSAGSRNRGGCRERRRGALRARRGTSESAGSYRQSTLRWHRHDTIRRAGRSRHGRHDNRHFTRPQESLSARLHT